MHCPLYASASVWECICFCTAMLMSGCANNHETANTWAARYNIGLLIKLTPKGVVFPFHFFVKQQMSYSASLYFYTAKPWHAVLHDFLESTQVVSKTARSSTRTHSLSVTQHQHTCALQLSQLPAAVQHICQLAACTNSPICAGTCACTRRSHHCLSVPTQLCLCRLQNWTMSVN